MDWNIIKAEYVAGGTSYRKLAKKYDVPFSTLKNVAIKEKWTQLREQAQNRTNTKLVENVSKKVAKIDDKYYRIVDKLLDKISDTMDALEVWDSQSIKHFTSAMKDLKDIKGIKSDADMREQEARIKKLQKDAEKEDDTVNEIEIVFNAGPEEWNE